MSINLRNMTHDECLTMMEGAHYGHLACSFEGQPYVIPIYFAFQARVAYSFSMPGRKVEWMRQNPKVCLQVEEELPKGSWRSVVINGRFQELSDDDVWRGERMHAWELLERHLNWWEIGSLKIEQVPLAHVSQHLFYGIYLNDISGRAATRAD